LLSSRFAQVVEGESRFQRSFKQFQKAYSRVLQWALSNPKKIVASVLIILIVSIAGIPFLGTEFLPEQDQNIIYLDVRLPVGSPLAASLALTQEVDRRLKDIPEITNAYVQVGGVGQFQVAAGTISNRSNYT